MKSITRSFAIAASLAFMSLCGCHRLTDTSAHNEAKVKHYVDLLRQQNFDEIEKDADPGIFPIDGDYTLHSMAAMFPGSEPLSIKLVASNTFTGDGFTKSSGTLEYHFPDRWLLVTVTERESGDTVWLTGFQVQQTPASVEERTRFTFSGKGALQYVAIILGILSLAFSLFAFVLCIRTPIVKRKWLWLIATLIGFGAVAVNWTTGQSDVAYIYIYFPTATIGLLPYGSWLIRVSIPLGAIIFVAARRHLVANPSSPPQ